MPLFQILIHENLRLGDLLKVGELLQTLQHGLRAVEALLTRQTLAGTGHAG